MVRIRSSMARALFSLVMAAICAQAVADETVPAVFHAETSTFFRPGFRVDGKAETLVYKVVFYSEEEKRVVTLMSVNIKPTPKEWSEFRHDLDSINVWQWRDDYVAHDILDGGGWSLEVKYADKRVKSAGENAYPGTNGEPTKVQDGKTTEPYRRLMNAMKILLGGRQFDSSEDDGGLYAVMTYPLPHIVLRDASCADTLNFLRAKGTENLRRDPIYKDAKLKFEYHYATDKPRGRVNYERKSVSYATARIGHQIECILGESISRSISPPLSLEPEAARPPLLNIEAVEQPNSKQVWGRQQKA